MNLIRLSLKNTRSQFKSFLMYFVSMAFGVMVYYSFIAMSFDTALLEEIRRSNNLAGSLRAASVMIVLFIIVFMFSANGFFLKKRKQEIALYNLLGMRKFEIGALFFVENSLIGLSALMAGLAGGVLLSKLFSMILIKVMFLSINNHFSLSLAAIKQTTITFLIILFVVSLRSAYVVYRYKLVDLLEASKKGDRYLKNSFLTITMGVLGLSFLSYGYYQAAHLLDYIFYLGELTDSDMGLIYGIFIILFSCIFGSYLFFYGFLPTLLALLQANKGFYYRDIKSVTVSSLRFHIRKNASTLGTIAVLLGTALSAIGGATDVYSFGMESVNSETPTDYIINTTEYPELKAMVKDMPQYSIGKSFDITLKVTGGHYRTKTFEQIDHPYTGAISLLALSDYQVLSETNSDLTPIELKRPDQVVIYDQMMGGYAITARSESSDIYLQNREAPLHVSEIRGGNFGAGFSSRYDTPTLIVSDQLYKSIKEVPQYSLTFLNIKNDQDSELLSDRLMSQFMQKEYYLPVDISYVDQQIIGSIGPEQPFNKEEDHTNKLTREVISTRFPAVKENRISYGMLVYTAVFLGIVFFIATGSMIMLKQLSEAEEERSRYQMLRKIGVSQRLIKQSIYRQNLLVFLGPLIIASLHSFFALKALSFLISNTSSGLTWSAWLIFIIIYFSFYWATSASYIRMVNE